MTPNRILVPQDTYFHPYPTLNVALAEWVSDKVIET